jgi:hypothetical protein
VEQDTVVQSRAAVLPGRGVGIADEVTQLIMMLMTNDYMTGEVVHVDKPRHDLHYIHVHLS